MNQLHRCLYCRWLSRGKILTRLLELPSKNLSFIMNHSVKLVEYVNDMTRLCQFLYLAYIISKMNESSFYLKEKNLTIFDTSYKICELKNKINFWVEYNTKE